MLYQPKAIWTKKHFFIGALYVCGIFSSIFGVYSLYVSLNSQEIVTEKNIESQICEKDTNFGIVTAYISGSVHNAGLYELQTGQRIYDLIVLAGGVTDKVDKVYLNKYLNLAEKVEDGQQVYIPSNLETEEELQPPKKESVASNIFFEADGVSINEANQDELETLSGVGEVRAKAIIENRPYSALSELISKKVLTDSLFTKLEPMLRL